MERVKTLVAHLQGGQPNLRPAEDGVPDSLPVHISLRGNFAPVAREVGPVRIQPRSGGAVPGDLRGRFLRCGPNPLFDFRGRPYHPFDGSGHVSAVEFPGGGTTRELPVFSNRWVRTRRLEASLERGFDVSEFGEGELGNYSYFAHMLDSEGERMGTANTNMVVHGGKLLVLEEADKPYELSRDVEMRTLGRYSFASGALSHHVTAHPRLDPTTGELVMFAYNVRAQPYCYYTVANAQGDLTVDAELPESVMSAPVMMHDFAITEHHSILFNFHFQFHMERVMEGASSPFVHHKDRPAEFLVFDRYCDFSQPEQQVRRFKTPPCAVFHWANAWEERNGRVLVLVGGRRPHAALSDVASSANRLWLWRLDLDSGKATDCAFDPGDRHADDWGGVGFLQVNQRFSGRRKRFVYATRSESLRVDEGEPASATKGAVARMIGFVKFDLGPNCDGSGGGTTRGVMFRTSSGRAAYGGEVVFAPSTRASANPCRPEEEDLGYLVSYVHDEESGESECVVWDAQSLREMCRLPLPQRVPYGFHAYFDAQ